MMNLQLDFFLLFSKDEWKKPTSEFSKGETKWKGNLMFWKLIKMDTFINIENILLKQFG
jgi:hypothetical protein